MKKYILWFRILLIGGALIIAAGLVYSTHLSNLKNLAYHINGKVEMVSYEIKREATVFINDTTYYLSYPDWDFDHNRIEVGDSIIKKRNSLVIKLIHKNGRIIVEGNDK